MPACCGETQLSQRDPIISPPSGERHREGGLLRLGILASHAGTTMQAIVDACLQDRLHAEVRVVIGNNSRSGALARARTHGIATAHLSGVTHPNADDLDRAIMETLDDHRVEVVALAGYMKRLGPLVLSQYKGRMLNTHPALLPKFGGQGMFGDRVHMRPSWRQARRSPAQPSTWSRATTTRGPSYHRSRSRCWKGTRSKPYASASKRLSANTTLTCWNESPRARSR